MSAVSERIPELSVVVQTPAIRDPILGDPTIVRTTRGHRRPRQFARKLCRCLREIGRPSARVDERVRAPAVHGVIDADAAVVRRNVPDAAGSQRLELNRTAGQRRRELARVCRRRPPAAPGPCSSRGVRHRAHTSRSRSRSATMPASSESACPSLRLSARASHSRP